MPNLITYTFPADCPVTALRGKTFTVRRISRRAVNGKATEVAEFVEKFEGRDLAAIVAGKPELEAAVATYRAAEAAERQAARDALEAAAPGVHRLIELFERASNDAERHHEQFEAMMADEHNDGINPPRAINQDWRSEYEAARAEHPRAALYLKAKLQAEGAHWADNTGKGAAGSKAMSILAAGGSIEEATAALAARRDFTD